MRPSAASPRDPDQPRLDLKIEFRHPGRVPVDRALLLRVAERVVANEGLSGPLRLSLHLLDDAALRRANRDRRGIDTETDVLSFPLLDELQSARVGFALPPGEPRHLGDVLISYDRARAQAAEYGHSLEREMCYLLAHGLLHLLGYDHQQQGEQRIMRRKEEAALIALGLSR